METQVKFIRVLYLVVLTASLLILVSPFIIPIFFAATVSLALYPLFMKLENIGLKRRGAAAILTTMFTIIISVPLSFFLVKGTLAVTKQLERISFNEKFKDEGVQGLVLDLRQDLVILVQKFSSKYELLNFLDQQRIESYLIKVNTFLLKFFSGLASGLPTMSILLIVMILCTYSFLKYAQKIKKFFQAVFGLSDEKMNELTHIFIKDSRQVYLSNILTGSIQSVIVATGVAILGLGDFFLVFFVTLILSFIPVVGAAPVAFLFALLAFFKDNTSAAVILLIVGSFTGIIDNILRPWLATYGESRVPPIVAFVCVIGGALWIGFPGLFIGLLIASIAYDTLPLFWEEIGKK